MAVVAEAAFPRVGQQSDPAVAISRTFQRGHRYLRAGRLRQRRLHRLVPLGLALAVLAGCGPLGSIDLTGPADFGTKTIRVQGTVTAATDGRPLAGVTVVAPYVGDREEKAMTDSRGRYSLTFEIGAIALGTPLVAHLDGFNRGFEPRVTMLETLAWGSRGSVLDTTLNFPLRPTRPITVSVRGQVTKGSTGEPIEAAVATVAARPHWAISFDPPFDIPQASATTNAEGHYVVVSSQFCAITGSSCFVSFRVTAAKERVGVFEDFEDMNIAGDSLSLTVNFDTLG